jgi:hypothetical protein
MGIAPMTVTETIFLETSDGEVIHVEFVKPN